MLGIEKKMKAAGYTGRVKEAQVLYVLALSDYAAEDGFIDKLEHLKWYAAFHNESHHPHVHLMVYADEGIKPYLSQAGHDESAFGICKGHLCPRTALRI